MQEHPYSTESPIRLAERSAKCLLWLSGASVSSYVAAMSRTQPHRLLPHLNHARIPTLQRKLVADFPANSLDWQPVRGVQ